MQATGLISRVQGAVCEGTRESAPRALHGLPRSQPPASCTALLGNVFWRCQREEGTKDTLLSSQLRPHVAQCSLMVSYIIWSGMVCHQEPKQGPRMATSQ